jgi:hypothetical protein
MPAEQLTLTFHGHVTQGSQGRLHPFTSLKILGHLITRMAFPLTTRYFLQQYGSFSAAAHQSNKCERS